MFLGLLSLGLVLTAAGLVTIGFGVPINAFSLGNTLIIAGTTALTGGLVLIGLAAVVRQLRRIANALAARPVQRQPGPAESAESFVPPTAVVPQAIVRAPPPPARPPAPPKPPEPAAPRAPEPRLAEPHFPAAASADAPGPLDWLRPKSRAPSNGEPPVVEVEDEAPLSPRVPPPPAFSPVAGESEPEAEPKAWPPVRPDVPPESVPAPAPRPEQAAPERPRSERRKRGGLFDVVWPDSKPARSAGEAVEPDMPSPPAEPPAARDERAPDTISVAERAPVILKSGVIDGMAYTLYADGAIEADLPQGTVRFASVDALRAHLEKYS